MNKYTVAILLTTVVVAGICFGINWLAPEFILVAMLSATGIMAVLSLVSYYLVARQFAGRPQAFVTGASASSLLKLLVCAGGILVYALASRPNMHKPTIFILMGIYFAFTIVEKYFLGKAAKVRIEK